MHILHILSGCFGFVQQPLLEVGAYDKYISGFKNSRRLLFGKRLVAVSRNEVVILVKHDV